jgi:1-acyl-sn-glycerol-3-phosphate acyltransferase
MATGAREPLYAFGIVLLRALLGFLRVRRSATGVDNLPDAGGAVLAMTHFGYLEFALVALLTWNHRHRPIRFVATKTAFDKPFVGGMLRAVKQIPVDLGAGADAYGDAVAALRSGELVGVFPEAGVDASFTVRELKTGAVRLAREAGVPLIPIAVWGGQRLLTKNHWVGFRERFGVRVSFAVGAPVAVSGDVHEATAALRDRLRELLAPLQAAYPGAARGAAAGAWWQPRHLGGAAPTPDEAVALDRDRAAAKERGSHG